MQDKFKRAIEAIVKVGGRPNLIGGSVRDQFLNLKPKDLDVEVFHLTVKQLIAALSTVGHPNVDSRKFGVIRLDCGLDEAVEFSLPRKDNATGERGFGGVFPDLSAQEAAFRRDFTFNAMSQSLITGEIIDPFDGLSDLRAGVIRHCHDQFFCEDPIRGPRGFRFAGQINGVAAPETRVVIRSMNRVIRELPAASWWSEFEKWATRSIVPSQGLRFLVDTGMIDVFPEIEALIDCPQDPEWHPEGDVFSHTCHTVDAAAGQGLVPVLAALCHDFGKATHTIKCPTRDRWISPGHAAAGEKPTRSFLARIGAPKVIVKQVVELVREHMVRLGSGADSKRKARRLLVRLAHASADDLFRLIEADHSGRPPLPAGLPEQARTLQAVCDEVANEVSPFVMGRHLIASGIDPGPHFGPILREAFAAQIEGAFSDEVEGLVWLRERELI